MTSVQLVDPSHYFVSLYQVKIWNTFNEPNIFCEYGYGRMAHAPFVNSSGVGPYLCNYHVLLANAKVYR